MDIQGLIDQSIASTGPEDQHRILAAQVAVLEKNSQDEVAAAFKQQADQLMRTDIKQSVRVAKLIVNLSEITGNPLHRALGLLAQANACSVVLGEYAQGVALYDQAAEIYAEHSRPVEQAQSQIGKIYALGNLGQYKRAQAEFNWASQVLIEHEEWFQLARLTVNMAIVHARLGQDSEALGLFDQAKAAYRQLGIEGEPHWLRVELNRAVVLRNLGRFEESIAASRTAMEMHHRLGQEVAAARAQQALAVTYFVIGRYNEALEMLEGIRQVLLADDRQRHAMLVELFISDCLLQLRRFDDVLGKCRQVRALFSELGTHYEVGQAILNEASAYAGQQRFDQALVSLAEARQIFEAEGNLVAIADADLQRTAVLTAQNLPLPALELAQACARVYQEHDLPIWQGRSELEAARAALVLGCPEDAQQLIEHALKIGEAHGVPSLTYACHHLIGRLAVQSGDPLAGLEAIELAILDIERLCGRLMVEYRSGFVEDKSSIYEDAVALCLELNEPGRGLEYAERAKSRALLELLAHRLDLSITARNNADQPLVDELTRLRQQRDRLYRRMDSGEGYGQRGESTAFHDDRHSQSQLILELEKQITERWHRLLVRNADYAREAALWQVRAESFQSYLQPDDLLVEFFSVHGRLVAFLADNQQVQAVQLETGLAQIQQYLQLLWLNLRSVPHQAGAHLANLETNIQGVLSRLHKLLWSPLAPALEAHGPIRRLILVPHGPLHYLPFQALYDGNSYLVEKFELSYLPGSSLLKYCLEPRQAQGDLVAFGHSYQGRLPFTLLEARQIAGLWSLPAILEEQATLDELRRIAPTCRILHLAAHGDFRPDNPLFSGLALADGWLTTLDIFNLKLQASLVTLSACQTGRSVVGGGDELLGLMRAFLAAGAASLVSTLWAVEDQSSARLMQSFYTKLSGGWDKGSALRHAQLELLRQPGDDSQTSHPYFWAPFFLVGASGPL
jgi:CHAT domain-containing protein/tetratricopeptide (TPR) repeat protein